VVKGVLVFWEKHDFNRAILVVRSKDEMIGRNFHIPDRTMTIVRDGINVGFTSAIRL